MIWAAFLAGLLVGALAAFVGGIAYGVRCEQERLEAFAKRRIRAARLEGRDA
jgi:hypothetical protein